MTTLRDRTWPKPIRRCRGATVLLLAVALGLGLLVSSPSSGGQAFAAGQRTKPPPVDPQVAALKKLRRASDGPTNVTFVNGFPHVVQTAVQVTGDTSVQRAKSFLKRFKNLYGLFMRDPFADTSPKPNRLGIPNPDDRFRDYLRLLDTYQGKPTSTPDLGLAVRATHEPGETVVAFRQLYRGVPVWGGDLLVFVQGDRVSGTVGALLSDLSLDVAPKLTERQAERAARAALRSRSARALARTHLVVFDPSLLPALEFTRSDPHLAWHVALADSERHIAFVDAQNGRLLFSYSQLNSHTDGYDLDLEDANGVNAASTDCYWSTDENDTLGDEDGLNSDGQSDPAAVALWDYAKQAYSFYHETFGLHSYDDDDGQYELYVHADVPNSRWSSGANDCDLIEFADGWVAYDVLLHELGHATADYTALFPPVGQGQSGALDESHGDTMGALAEGDWLIGEDVVGGPIRSMSNPPGYGDPDRMTEWVPTNIDNGGVHTNSGIPSKAASLLADGGTHPDTGISVEFIGRSPMGWLTFNVLQLMPGNAGFIDARGLTLMLADAKYPDWVACSVRNAWAAVEVGNPDLNCNGVEEDPDPDGDGVSFVVDNCPTLSNPSQTDTNNDGVGDACDQDADGDGVDEWGGGFPYDNCPGVPNPDQKDENLNGVGDLCDPDFDGDFDDDGIQNSDDNCKLDPNPGQEDADNDGDGDACDPDSDGDGISNDDDNAPFEYNPSQSDKDGDGLGDVSDGCPETTDEVTAWTKGNPEIGIDPTPIQPDFDGDGTPDACDDDFRMAGKFVGSRGLAPDGRSRAIEAKGLPDRYLRLPLTLAAQKAPEWFTEADRLTLTITGLDDRVKVWITDEEGRSVARSKPKIGRRRTLRFRPIAGHRYALFLYFNTSYEPGLTETFSMSMISETVERRPPPPPPVER